MHRVLSAHRNDVFVRDIDCATHSADGGIKLLDFLMTLVSGENRSLVYLFSCSSNALSGLREKLQGGICIGETPFCIVTDVLWLFLKTGG